MSSVYKPNQNPDNEEREQEHTKIVRDKLLCEAWIEIGQYPIFGAE
jgi:hypothetical protein